MQGKFIYVLKCGEVYKIGVTEDIDRRIKQLSTAAPYPLELICSLYLDSEIMEVEQLFHDHLKEKRIHREWFRLDNDDIDCLKYVFSHVELQRRTGELE